MTPGIQPQRQRIFYLDFIRVLAAILIVITHFNNPYIAEDPIFLNQPFNIYIGGLGVSLFLIISGSALMYTYGDDEKFSLKEYYYKRFIGIYPMFWIAFIIANAFLFLRNGGHIFSSAPKWSIIFSVFAIDGLIANTSFPTFYTLGEWFLGFIVLFYLIFPILRYGVKKHPVVTAIIISVIYLYMIIKQPRILNLPNDILLPTRLPELVFGMYFVRYIKQVPIPLLFFSGIFLTVQSYYPIVTGSLAVTIVGICMFLVLVWLAGFCDHQPVRVPVKSVARYSYAIFLVHHVVISQIFTIVNPMQLSYISKYILFAVDCIIIFSLAVILFRLEKGTIKYIQAMFADKPNA